MTMHVMNLMNECGHITTYFPEYTMTHIHGHDYAGDCINASILYTVRERPQMTAKGIKKPLITMYDKHYI